MIHNKSEENENQFDINELIISWLISALMIIGVINLKTNYDLNKQKDKTIQAMSVAIEINNQKELLDDKNNELSGIIRLQAEYYKNELQKRSKYEDIIKDIDRTWNKPK